MTSPVLRRWFVGCVAILALCGGCGKQEWKEHVCSEGGYRVLLPGIPQSETEAVRTPLGELHLNKTKADLGSLVYMVIYADLIPAMQFVPDQPLLEAAQHGMAARGYALHHSQPAALGNVAGVELRCTNEQEGIYCRARLFRVKSRMYQIAVYSNSESRVLDADADRVFASFRLR